MKVSQILAVEHECRQFFPNEDRIHAHGPMFAKLLEECGELAGITYKYEQGDCRITEEEYEKRIEDEYGDVLFMLARIAARYQLVPEKCLELAIRKMQRRRAERDSGRSD